MKVTSAGYLTIDSLTNSGEEIRLYHSLEFYNHLESPLPLDFPEMTKIKTADIKEINRLKTYEKRS